MLKEGEGVVRQVRASVKGMTGQREEYDPSAGFSWGEALINCLVF